MKYLTLLILFNIGLWSACNSQDSAPASAVNAFKAKYPNVQNPKWEKESADEWEAEFKADGREMSAVFKSDGTWLESETEIKAEDLPKAVQEGIAETGENEACVSAWQGALACGVMFRPGCAGAESNAVQVVGVHRRVGDLATEHPDFAIVEVR